MHFQYSRTCPQDLPIKSIAVHTHKTQSSAVALYRCLIDCNWFHLLVEAACCTDPGAYVHY